MVFPIHSLSVLGLVFCLNQISISLVVWHIWQFHFGFYGFCFFLIFLNGSPNSLLVRFLGLVFFLFSQWKFFELYVRTCPAMFFISSSWFLLRPYDVTATFCSFVHAISTELHVWRHFSLLVERVFLFMRVIKFLVTLNLPHSQKWLPHFEIDFYLL